MRVAIYARVSTDDKEQNPERQFIKCRQYCELHNHEVIGEFSDYISGKIPPTGRGGFNDILHKTDAIGIVVYSIDRLSRERPEKVLRFLSEMKDKGYKIISITEPAFNMEGEFSDLLQYIITWFNSWYLRSLSQNVKSGQERARKQGKKIGRSKKKFNRMRAYHLLVNEMKSQRYVAKELRVSQATISRFKNLIAKDKDLFIKIMEDSKTDVSESK